MPPPGVVFCADKEVAARRSKEVKMYFISDPTPALPYREGADVEI